MLAEIEYLRDLKERFVIGKIDEADVAEAFRIIQEEAILLKHVNDLYMIIDNLTKCGKAIMLDGKVSIVLDARHTVTAWTW